MPFGIPWGIKDIDVWQVHTRSLGDPRDSSGHLEAKEDTLLVYPLVISQAAESHTKNGIQALDSAA